jgi:hypothetical protein
MSRSTARAAAHLDDDAVAPRVVMLGLSKRPSTVAVVIWRFASQEGSKLLSVGEHLARGIPVSGLKVHGLLEGTLTDLLVLVVDHRYLHHLGVAIATAMFLHVRGAICCHMGVYSYDCTLNLSLMEAPLGTISNHS